MSTIGPDVQQPEDGEPPVAVTDGPTPQAPAPAATTDVTGDPERRDLRTGTVVWGLSDWRIEPDTASIFTNLEDASTPPSPYSQ